MYDLEEYCQAADINEAVAALSRDPQAMPIAGGTDILIQVREGRHAGCHLVNLHGMEALHGIRMEPDGTLYIASGSTFSEITHSPVLLPHVPMLCEAVDQVGSPQIRNMGTVGGNVCNGVTSADSAPSLMALNAVMELRGMQGTRLVPIAQWYTGPGKTARAHDEILMGIRIAQADYDGFFGHYIKYGKRAAMEISTLGCAVLVKLTPDKTAIAALRIAFGVAGPCPIRCTDTEAMAVGRTLSADLVTALGHSVLSEIHPRDSWRASMAFRQHLAGELCRRAFRQAVTLAGGEIHA